MFYNSKYPLEYTIGVRELVAMGCVLVDRTTMFGVEYVEMRFQRGPSKIFELKGCNIVHKQSDSIDKMIYLVDFVNKNNK